MILLTGATDGIGLALAKRLAARGDELILHGRSDARLAAAAHACGGKVETERADFAKLDEVRALARRLARHGELVVINNAGVGAFARGAERATSSDGLELCWAVNFLAPFALTESLIAEGVKLPAIVNVASAGQAPVDVEDPNLERSYEPWLAYRRSKLAMIAWTFDLAEKSRDRAVNALHPGTFLSTKMVIEANVAPQGTPDSGARAIERLLDKTIAREVTGAYFDVDRRARALPQAYDPAFRAWLRAHAEQLTGISAPRSS